MAGQRSIFKAYTVINNFQWHWVSGSGQRAQKGCTIKVQLFFSACHDTCRKGWGFSWVLMAAILTFLSPSLTSGCPWRHACSNCGEHYTTNVSFPGLCISCSCFKVILTSITCTPTCSLNHLKSSSRYSPNKMYMANILNASIKNKNKKTLHHHDHFEDIVQVMEWTNWTFVFTLCQSNQNKMSGWAVFLGGEAALDHMKLCKGFMSGTSLWIIHSHTAIHVLDSPFQSNARESQNTS